MFTVIEQADRGPRKAMEYLYESNKKRIFWIAQNLLLDCEQAAEVTETVFERVWNGLEWISEEDFYCLVIMKTVDCCRWKAWKKMFAISGEQRNESVCDTAAEYILANLPVVTRYIFVLHTVGQLNEKQIAQALRMKTGKVCAILEKEKKNIEQLLQVSEKGYTDSYEQIVRFCIQWEKNNSVPGRVDRKVYDTIKRIAASMEL